MNLMNAELLAVPATHEPSNVIRLANSTVNTFVSFCPTAIFVSELL